MPYGRMAKSGTRSSCARRFRNAELTRIGVHERMRKRTRRPGEAGPASRGSLLNQFENREFRRIAMTHPRLHDPGISARSSLHRWSNLLDELLHHRGFSEELRDITSRSQVPGHRSRNQPLGNAANLFCLGRCRLYFLMLKQRRCKIPKERLAMPVRTRKPFSLNLMRHNLFFSLRLTKRESPLCKNLLDFVQRLSAEIAHFHDLVFGEIQQLRHTGYTCSFQTVV